MIRNFTLLAVSAILGFGLLALSAIAQGLAIPASESADPIAGLSDSL